MKLKHNYGNQVYHIFFHRPEGLDWAQNTTNGNMSWRNNILYSYSSELGWADFDKKIIWIRNGSYSNTTSKHQSYLRMAVPPDWIKIYIDEWRNWSRSRWNEDSYIPSYHLELQRWIESAKENKESLYKGVKYFGNIDYVVGVLNTIKEILTKVDQLDLYDNFEKEISKYRFTDEEIQIWNVKSWCNENGITGSYKTKLKVFNNPELAEEVIGKNRIRKERLDATKEERRLKTVQRSIEKWYSGEVGNINFHNNGRAWRNWYNGIRNPVYLRIKPSDDKMVQTSLNVEVPLVECAMLYRKFKQCRDTNTTWHQNGDKFRIGYYQVESITERTSNRDSSGLEWCITVGCHQIFDTQIEEFVNRFTNWNKND